MAEHRQDAEEAYHAQDRVTEIAELIALERRGALRPGGEKRLVDLLLLRAHDWAALGRPIPLADDLRHVIALAPGRAVPLAPRLRTAETAAGDLWLGLGENARAEQEYRAAEKLGGDFMDLRFRAVWGASIADLNREAIDRAMVQLPPRALAPFTVQYLARGGAKPRLLRRAWLAARTFGPPALVARLEALTAAATFEAEPPKDQGALVNAESVKAPADDDFLVSGPTLARSLLPLAAAYPDLLAPGPRSRRWADWLIAEDPTSPDSLEVAALIDARAGRLGGAEQKLADLVFFSIDRAGAYARGAHVWERTGQVRRACAAWDRATRVAPVDDPRWCDLLACVKRDPRCGDADAIAAHIRDRAPKLACVAPPSSPEASDSAPPSDPTSPSPAAQP